MCLFQWHFHAQITIEIGIEAGDGTFQKTYHAGLLNVNKLDHSQERLNNS